MVAVISGESSVTTNASGSLASLGSSGTSAVMWSATGALTGSALLEGTSSVYFSASGKITYYVPAAVYAARLDATIAQIRWDAAIQQVVWSASIVQIKTK